MNIFSYVLLLWLFISLKNNEGLYQKIMSILPITVFISISNVRGYFLMVGNTEVTYNTFLMLFQIVLMCIYMFTRYNQYKKSKMLFRGTLALSVIIIGQFMELLIPYDEYIISDHDWDGYVAGTRGYQYAHITVKNFMSIYLFVFAVLLLIIICEEMKKVEVKKVLKKINMLCVVEAVYIFIEALMKNVFNSEVMVDLAAIIFGTGHSTVDKTLYRNDFIALMGWGREPSHVSQTLFYIITFYLIYKFYIKFNSKRIQLHSFIYLCFLIMLMYFTGSFAAYWYLCIIFVLTYCFLHQRASNKEKNILTTIAVLMVIGTIFAIIYIIDDTNNYIGNRLYGAITVIDYITSGSIKSYSIIGADSSALARFIGAIECYMVLYNRPFWGVGLGLIDSNNGLATLLANLGVVGCVFWGWFVLKNNKCVYKYIILTIIMPQLVLGGLSGFYNAAFCFLVVCFKKYI